VREKVKYFVLNKEEDYRRGSGSNLEYLSPGIRIKDTGRMEGRFFSRLFDSREKQTKWHRLLVERASLARALVRFCFYASDSRFLEYGGKGYDIGDLLQDKTIDTDRKRQMLSPFLIQELQDPEDALLFGVEGRYLWFQVILTAQGQLSPEIYRIKIFFPKNTWMEYLPEVYQMDPGSASFVERFLGIYQTIYQDMTEQIDGVAANFDPDAVEEELLRWLSGWLSIEDSHLWTRERLRYLVKHAMELYSIRGTVEYIERMIALYTGRQPYIIEYHQLEPFLQDAGQAELIGSLYGDNKFIFTVIAGLNAVGGNSEYKILTRIIENSKPAHMDCNVVVLEPFIFLSRHSYLGINSVLGQYQDMVLDGQAALSFTRLNA